MLAIGCDGGFDQKVGLGRFLVLTHHEVDLITSWARSKKIRFRFLFTCTIGKELGMKPEARIQRDRTLDLHTRLHHLTKSCGAVGMRARR